MPRHRHAQGYIAVVLEGSYVEAGGYGRVLAKCGTVIPHRAHSAHMDRFGANGATVLNLPFAADINSIGELRNIDELAIQAERDPNCALEQLREAIIPAVDILQDWPDLLAQALRSSPAIRIESWAEANGLNPASVSRGFRKAFGVSPKRYRLEYRTEMAIGAIAGWNGSLADLAIEFGFADQSHLTRSVVALTGESPMQLRAKSVQALAKDS